MDNVGQAPRSASPLPRTRVKRAPRGRSPRNTPRTRVGRRQGKRASTARRRPTPQCTPLASRRTRRALRLKPARASASRSLTFCYALAHGCAGTMLNARLGATCSVLGRETDCRKPRVALRGLSSAASRTPPRRYGRRRVRLGSVARRAARRSRAAQARRLSGGVTAPEPTARSHAAGLSGCPTARIRWSRR